MPALATDAGSRGNGQPLHRIEEARTSREPPSGETDVIGLVVEARVGGER